MYAAGSGVWLSVDGGHTWQNVYADQGLEAIALHPSDPDQIYAAGRYKTYGTGSPFAAVGTAYSDDGGQAWHVVKDQPGWDLAISQAAPHRAVIALGENGIAVQDAPRRKLPQEWKQFSEGLPVFLQKH